MVDCGDGEGWLWFAKTLNFTSHLQIDSSLDHWPALSRLVADVGKRKEGGGGHARRGSDAKRATEVQLTRVPNTGVSPLAPKDERRLCANGSHAGGLLIELNSHSFQLGRNLVVADDILGDGQV